jgi:hypothetical protein
MFYDKEIEDKILEGKHKVKKYGNKSNVNSKNTNIL